MWTHSQPSGNPFTSIVNCLYNSMIVRYVWVLIMRERKPSWSSMKAFNEHVTMVAYGDDNCINISDDASFYFNQLTISETMIGIKHGYTEETKGKRELVSFRSINDINFLKRDFVYCPELCRHIAPLKKEVIYEMLNWTRNTVDPDEILKANIEVAFREIVLHGEHEYNLLRENLKKNQKFLPFSPIILTYAEYLFDFSNQSDAFYDF